MAIGDDFEVQANGNIRHVSGTSTYTVLELHRWLQDLADNATASGDDLLDITYPNPSARATDKIIALLNGYNIGATEAQYLYGGSITQLDGTEQYSGLQVLGSVYSSTTLQIVQNNTLLTPYWGTGLNNSGQTLLRILVKTRTANADIDGKRIEPLSNPVGGKLTASHTEGSPFDWTNIASRLTRLKATSTIPDAVGGVVQFASSTPVASDLRSGIQRKLSLLRATSPTASPSGGVVRSIAVEGSTTNYDFFSELKRLENVAIIPGPTGAYIVVSMETEAGG